MRMAFNKTLTQIPSLFTDLATILAGEIDCSLATLTKYSNDGSPYTVKPQAIIFPKNTTDIKHILSFAREYTMPVTVRGKGRARSGGSLGDGIILDMSRYFSQIRTVNMMENTVTVDAGVTLGDLLEKLHTWKFDIPLLAENNKETTIGALVATKSTQSGSSYHGTVREWIEGITVVVDNGEEHHIADGITPSGRLLGIYQSVFPLLTKENPVLRASKPKSSDDATGYNVWNTSIGPRQLLDQITGSEGTLGIITSVTFRITPIKPYHVTTFIPIAHKEQLSTYIDIAKENKGEHFFMYDEAFMQLSERYHPTLVPFFPNTPYALMVTHSGNDENKLANIHKTFTSSLPIPLDLLVVMKNTDHFGRITDTDFLYSLCSMYTNNSLSTDVGAGGIIIPLPLLDSFLQEAEEYLNSLGRLYSITGNIGSGHLSFTTLFDVRSLQYENDLLSYTKNIFSLVKKYNGGISATGGDGLVRTPFLPYIYNDATLSVFKKIKAAWDPLLILNPGKKLGASSHYLAQHLSRPI